MPWDQLSFFGWLIEIILSVIATIVYLIVSPAILTFFVWICEYHFAFYGMFEARIREVDAKVKHNMFSEKNIKKSLSESIAFHVSVKR